MSQFRFVAVRRFVPGVLLFMLLGSVAFARAASNEVNYDTAWTFVYDGGRDSASGFPYDDIFFDVKALSSGSCVCVGGTSARSLLIKLDAGGNVLQKQLYTTNNTVHSYYNSQTAHSIAIAQNGDFLVGGERYNSPWIMRLDSVGAIKWSTWYYDSTKGVNGILLQGKGVINCLRETRRGTIICAAGDEYPSNGGWALNNYAAYLEFDSAGQMIDRGESINMAGYKVGGFYIEETGLNTYLLSGNQNVFYTDSAEMFCGRKNTPSPSMAWARLPTTSTV